MERRGRGDERDKDVVPEGPEGEGGRIDGKGEEGRVDDTAGCFVDPGRVVGDRGPVLCRVEVGGRDDGEGGRRRKDEKDKGRVFHLVTRGRVDSGKGPRRNDDGSLCAKSPDELDRVLDQLDQRRLPPMRTDRGRRRNHSHGRRKRMGEDGKRRCKSSVGEHPARRLEEAHDERNRVTSSIQRRRERDVSSSVVRRREEKRIRRKQVSQSRITPRSGR